MPKIKISEQMVNRLRSDFPELDIPADVRVVRTFRGPRQAEAGTFSWYLASDVRPAIDIGSEDSMSDIAKAGKIGYYRTGPTKGTICISVADFHRQGEQ